jgi:hypothetical protein
VLHLKSDFIKVGKNEKTKRLHTDVLFGLKSIFGEKSCIFSSLETNGNDAWFVLSYKKMKKIITQGFAFEKVSVDSLTHR